MEESIAQVILSQVNLIANQVNNIQIQVNGLQNQFNAMQNQMNTMQDQMNGMQDQMNTMQDDIKAMDARFSKAIHELELAQLKTDEEIQSVKAELKEVKENALFARETCETIVKYLEKEEKTRKKMQHTLGNHEKRIFLLESGKNKMVPLL